MSSLHVQAIEALADEAARADWKRVAQACSVLRATEFGSMLVASASDVDSASFLEWLAEIRGAASVESMPLKSLHDNPWPALASCQVVVLASARYLPQPDDLAAWNKAITLLPAAMRSVIVVAEEGIGSDADAKAVSRVAWGAFVPEPKPIWEGQDLSTYNIFLWAPGSSGALNLTESRARAAAALKTTAALHENEARLDLAVDMLLALAEDEIANGVPERTASAKDQERRQAVWRLQETAATMTEQLRRALVDASQARQVAVQATATRMQETVVRGLGNGVSEGNEQREGRLAEQVEALRLQLAAHAASTQADWGDRVRRELEGVPWTSLRSATGDYREALVEAWRIDIRPDAQALLLKRAAPRVGEPWSTPSRPMLSAGTAVVAAVGGALLSGPGAAAVCAVVGALGGAAAGKQLVEHARAEIAAARRRDVSAFAFDAELALKLQVQDVESKVLRAVRVQMERIADDSSIDPTKSNDSARAREQHISFLKHWRGRMHPTSSSSP